MPLAHAGIRYSFTANGNISAGNVCMLETGTSNVQPIAMIETASSTPVTDLNVTSLGTNLTGSDRLDTKLNDYNYSTSQDTTASNGIFTAYNTYDSNGATGGYIVASDIDSDGHTHSTPVAITGTDAGDCFYNMQFVNCSGGLGYSMNMLLMYTKYDASTDTASNHCVGINGTAGSGLTLKSVINMSSVGLPTGQDSWYVQQMYNGTNQYVFAYVNPSNNYAMVKKLKIVETSNSIAGVGSWVIGNAHTIASEDVSANQQIRTFRMHREYEKFLFCSDSKLYAGTMDFDNDTFTVGGNTTPTTDTNYAVSKLSADWDHYYTDSYKVVAVYDTGANNGSHYVCGRVGWWDSATSTISFSGTTQYPTPTVGGTSGSSSITCLVNSSTGALVGGRNPVQGNNSNLKAFANVSEQYRSMKKHKTSGAEYLYLLDISTAGNVITFTETNTSAKVSTVSVDTQVIKHFTVNYSEPGLDFRLGSFKHKRSNLLDTSASIQSSLIIGVASENATHGDTVFVDLPYQVTETYSGLTSATTVYVDGFGVVSQTSNSALDTTEIGKAVSTTGVFLNSSTIFS
jgi:hypothetical protein